nr:Chain C, ORF1ab [Severe acute respiratory syndrome coronavirus 2]
IPRRNVATL